MELNAKAVLIDEKKGRQAARDRGITTLGTITVLELGARQDLIDLQIAFDALQRTSFQIAKPLLDAALKRDKASREHGS